MKKSLTIQSTEPVDDEELDLALHARDVLIVIQDALDELRSKAKYEGQEWARQARDLIYQHISGSDVARFFH